MGICTIGSIMYWLVVSVIVPHQTKFIKTRLIAMGKLAAAPHHMVRSFVENYLRNDGILIIELVSENASDLIAAELICALWEQYRDKADMNKKTEVATRGTLSPAKNGYETDTDDDDEDDDNVPRRYYGNLVEENPEESESEDDYGRKRHHRDDDDSDDDGGKKQYHPPIPPKPKKEDMQVTFRLPNKDQERLRKEKLLKEKRERELKELRRGDRKHLRSDRR